MTGIATSHRLAARYREVRAFTLTLTAPLDVEDMVLQSMPDASPSKWHLAHTTWFFERFVLKASVKEYREHHPRYEYLFNSYYEAVGPRHARPRRGLLSRPTVPEVMRYRAHVDEAVSALFARGIDESCARVIELGLHHEQQHQELLLTDIKHALAQNPLFPAYARATRPLAQSTASPSSWRVHEGGVLEIGHAGAGFAFDNEGPRHEVLLRPFEIASRPVAVGEYRAFIDDGGYTRPELWLSDGWEAVQREGWSAPLYWSSEGLFTLHGLRALDDDEPVCHVSLFEADAYARWANARLPTEHEHEVACRGARALEESDFVDDGGLHPRPPANDALLGGVWQWTQSAYAPYPGYRAAAGALGEYNGKFMINQLVLRGGSCLTSRSHMRPTYRNFFHAPDRWQMSGILLARDVEG